MSVAYRIGMYASAVVVRHSDFGLLIFKLFKLHPIPSQFAQEAQDTDTTCQIPTSLLESVCTTVAPVLRKENKQAVKKRYLLASLLL
jgi:hypothetical protein